MVDQTGIKGILARCPKPLQRLLGQVIGADGGHARSGLSAVAAFLIRASSAGVLVLVQILLARWLGAAGFGIYATAMVWVTVFGTLATLGLASSVVRFLPGFRERREFGAFLGFLRTGHLTAFVAGCGLAGCGLTALWLWPGAVEPHLLWPLRWALMCLPAFAVTDFQDGAGRAQGWIGVALLPPYVLRPLLILLLSGMAALAGFPATAAAAMVAALIAMWLTAFAQYLWLKWRLAAVAPPEPKIFAARAWVGASLPFLLLEALQLAMLNLDVLALNLFVAPAEIGVYFAAGRIISLIGFIHFAVTAVAMPRFAALEASGRRADILPFLHLTQTWTFIPSLIGAAILIAIGKPVLALFGAGFAEAYPLMYVLALGLIMRSLAGPAQSLLMAAGHQRSANLIVLAAVAVAGILHLLLIPIFGPLGAAIGMAAALGIEAFGTLAVVHRLFGRRQDAPA